MTPDRAGHFEHVLQIRTAVFAGRGTHRTHDDVVIVYPLRKVGSETEPPRLYVAQHHLLQARFVYRNHPAAQFLYLPFVDVDAGDVHPHVGETGSRHEPDIPGSHYG